MSRRRPRLAVLSYHSWRVPVATLVDDIRALRRAGWHMIDATAALELLEHGRAPASRCCLVTTDDGHEQDARFFEALEGLGCPAVSFINVGRLTAEQAAFFASLALLPRAAVEDHGRYHRLHFTSGRIRGYTGRDRVPGGLSHLPLVPGAPLFEHGSAIATRTFAPDAAVTALVADVAAAAESLAMRIQQVETRLLEHGLAHRIDGTLEVRGTREAPERFAERIALELAAGREHLRAVIGRSPRLFAYPYWQGSHTADRILAELGYRATFAGVGLAVAGPRHPFSVPRLRADEGVPRPLAPLGTWRARLERVFAKVR